jgi:hypothetical protein
MKSLFLTVFLTVIIVSQVNAQSTLALQEKCAEGAKKFFLESGNKLGVWSDEKNIYISGFECHYNKKLDKCFILTQNTTSSKNNKEDDPVWFFINLFDVFEGKEYGTFWREQHKNFNWPVRQCEVSGKKCSNEQEFRNLIRPYMEE